MHMCILSTGSDLIILIASKTYSTLPPRFVLGSAWFVEWNGLCSNSNIDWPCVTLGTRRGPLVSLQANEKVTDLLSRQVWQVEIHTILCVRRAKYFLSAFILLDIAMIFAGCVRKFELEEVHVTSLQPLRNICMLKRTWLKKRSFRTSEAWQSDHMPMNELPCHAFRWIHCNACSLANLQILAYSLWDSLLIWPLLGKEEYSVMGIRGPCVQWREPQCCWRCSAPMQPGLFRYWQTL